MSSKTKVVYLTAGAGGMFCGSCMHDNALARALSEHGFDVSLVPTYTPIRTDEQDVSVDQIFFGGINVYLQQKFPPLRWLPGFLDRFLDSPALINRITSQAIDMPAEELGKLALSMLKGAHGNQRKEVKRLCNWLATDARPEIILFTNMLIGGCIPEIKRTTNKPVIVTLQGDDIFLDSLPAHYRDKCIAEIKSLVNYVNGFIVHSEFYRDYISRYFEIPLSAIDVTPLGIDVSEFAHITSERNSEQPVIGYFARLSPEKGLHNLIEAFIRMKKANLVPNLKLKVAGWLGTQHKSYADDLFQQIKSAGFLNDFEHAGSIDREQKLKFLASIDVLSVPTDFLEPKGLYVLEAMAAGVPVVQPAHGSFPELIEQTGGGVLYEPGNIEDYCEKLASLLNNQQLRLEFGTNGQKSVHASRNSQSMADSTAKVLSKKRQM